MLSMFDGFMRVWRTLTLRASVVVFCVPCERYREHDAVAVLTPEIEKLRKLHLIVVLRSAKDHFLEILQTLGKRKRLNRVVLFAHPAETHEGFAVDSESGSVANVLRPDWWSTTANPACVELLVAHVCEGALVLRQSFWNGIFDSWISYEGLIECYVGSALGAERWARIARATITAAAEGSNTDSVLMRLKRAYVNQMIEMVDSPDASQGDILNLCNMERACRQLARSDP